MSDIELAEQRRALEDFANAGAVQNQPSGHAIVRQTAGLAERAVQVIGAQAVAVHRDEAKVLQKLSALAAAAGPDWFYRFPVRNNRTGGTDYIEGPSIKLANDVARIFGNNVNEIRDIDNGDSWTFYARFTDIETGFSYERAYRQRKGQTSLRTKDVDRQLDIAYSIGQSKAIRNCICNALQIYTDYAFEQARNSLVEKIGKGLNEWRARTIDGIAKIPVELVRVERVIGRAAKDWLAPDVAQVIALMRSVADGMASADEVFPPLDAAPQGAQSQEPGQPSSAATDNPKPVEAAGSAARNDATAAAPGGDPNATMSPEQLVAFNAGVADRKRGISRKLVPTGFLNDATLRESWLKGWDAGAA